MVRLFLRGLLRPELQEGVRSLMRERLLMGAVSREDSSAFQMARYNAEANVLPALVPKDLRARWASMQDGIQQAQAWAALRPEAEEMGQRPVDEAGKVLLDLYEALEKAGALEQIRKRDFDLERTIAEDFHG